MQWWFIHHDIFPIHKVDFYPALSAKCLLDAHNMFLIHNGDTIFPAELIIYLWVYLHVWVLVIIKVHWHQRERTPVINIRNGNSVTWLTRDGLVAVPHLKDDKWNVPVAMGKILCALGVYSLPSHIGVDPMVGGTHPFMRGREHAFRVHNNNPCNCIRIWKEK